LYDKYIILKNRGEKMRQQLNVTIDERLIKEVDKFAKRYKLTRSQAIENLVSASMADVEVLQAVGLIDLAFFVRGIHNKAERLSEAHEKA
jgi:metal-responsive CopG/Arc/MetJ family transcriptional regulator